MIRVTVGNNMTQANPFVVDASTITPKEAIERSGLSLRGDIRLNGTLLAPADFDKTFAELGVESGDAFVLNITKAVNA